MDSYDNSENSGPEEFYREIHRQKMFQVMSEYPDYLNQVEVNAILAAWEGTGRTFTRNIHSIPLERISLLDPLENIVVAIIDYIYSKEEIVPINTLLSKENPTGTSEASESITETYCYFRLKIFPEWEDHFGNITGLLRDNGTSRKNIYLPADIFPKDVLERLGIFIKKKYPEEEDTEE